MLYYREHEWMPVPGATRFTAWITPSVQSPEDVDWSLGIRYSARGAQWRRVQSWQRPSLFVEVSNFEPRIRRWTDLEQVNFWHLPDDDEFYTAAGFLNVDYAGLADNEDQVSLLNDHIWRVAGREGRLLTVELAAFADGRTLAGLLQDVPVLPDGSEDTADGADYWKQNAQLYLIEQVPFGMVSVQVPRNARDIQAYALGRARTVLGLENPEHIELMDHAQNEKASDLITGDIYAYLHFNGYFED